MWDEPDLTVRDISRDAYYYKIKYCNEGNAISDDTFTILLTNLTDNKSFESNRLYPYLIPNPGACKWSGGFTCGLIGDPSCNEDIKVKAIVDHGNTVGEIDEDDNTHEEDFGQVKGVVTIPSACENVTFLRDLGQGMTGPDVKCLQSILNLYEDTKVSLYGNGSLGNETYYFGQKTKDAVIRFQNKYSLSILSPYNLSRGTGFMGYTTRKSLMSY